LLSLSRLVSSLALIVSVWLFVCSLHVKLHLLVVVVSSWQSFAFALRFSAVFQLSSSNDTPTHIVNLPIARLQSYTSSASSVHPVILASLSCASTSCPLIVSSLHRARAAELASGDSSEFRLPQVRASSPSSSALRRDASPLCPSSRAAIATARPAPVLRRATAAVYSSVPQPQQETAESTSKPPLSPSLPAVSDLLTWTSPLARFLLRTHSASAIS
jgi:hypothetical protein